MLVQQQVNGYNLRNIDVFLAPYSDSVVIYDVDGKVLMRGKPAIREEYTKYFNKTPELHCQIVNRMVLGNTVVDQEKLTSATRKPSEGIAVYKIENGKIITVHFIE
jgi:hypothetical protein